MPTTWLFEPILRAFIVTSLETAPVDDFFRALDEVLAHPKARDRMRLLIDHTRIPTPTSEIVREGITRLVRYVSRLEHAEIAMVVPGTGDHGIGRMADLMLDGRLKIEGDRGLAMQLLLLVGSRLGRR